MSEEAGILQQTRERLIEIARENHLDDVEVAVRVKTLTPEEAIGRPGRRDFPIVKGKERVIEAEILQVKAHAFTDSPGEFGGKLREVLNLPLDSNRNRALCVATMNAVLGYLGLINKKLHCKDDDPVRCAEQIAAHILEKWGQVKVGLIGLNPAIAEMVARTFGSAYVRITDLNKENIGAYKYGVQIWDGHQDGGKLVRESDVVLITGTTLVNGTFDTIMSDVRQYDREYLIYGVTSAGICQLMNLNRICPYGRDQ